MRADDFEPLFAAAERAVKAHSELCGGERDGGCSPRLFVDRLGFGFEMTLKLRASRKRPTKARGDGDTPEEAVEDLILRLDYWAEAMK